MAERDVDLGIPGLEWHATLGRGGSGTVYQAFDERHGRLVAVKVLQQTTNDAGRRRFDRERQAMGSLGSHPNIVTILTSGYTAYGQPYLVMDQMPQGSLADRLRAGPLTVEQVLDLGRQLAGALDAAHQAGIVHCDVKPANVLMSKAEQPILTDFGIASVMGEQSMRVTVSATPSFAAPEVLQGRIPDQRSDIYSLAATLFTCLEGHPPFGHTSETAVGVLYQVLNDPVPTIDRPGVPSGVVAALRRAMAKDPVDRPSTMAEFATELEQETAFAPAPLPVAPPPGRRSMVAGAAILGSVVIGLGVLAIVVTTNDSRHVLVPNIADLPLADATLALDELGLAGTHEPACMSAIARSADPPAGVEVDPGATISIAIDPCIVPDFVGMRLAEAIDLVMTIDGLSIAWPDYCDDLVLRQDPVAGSSVNYDTMVAIELKGC